MRLSLCAIVRDEAERLPAMLESVRSVVDELCVLDTGSTDDTPALAAAAGARVGHFEWCDDFSAARNASLELATGDWALVLDADECLIGSGARERLLTFCAGHPEALGRLRILNSTDDGATSEADITRFFPLRAGLRYRGRIHEQVEASGLEPARLDTGVAARHDGYLGSRVASEDKLARNRRLIQAALEDSPADAYLWYQLGQTCFVAEDHATALASFTRALELLGEDEVAYEASLVETAAYALRQLGRSAEARALIQRLLPRFDGRPDTRFALALLDLDLGRIPEAEAGFRACLDLAGTAPRGGESNTSSSTWAPAYNLGVIHECTDRLPEALTWYQRALALHPGHEPSLQGLARCTVARAAI